MDQEKKIDENQLNRVAVNVYLYWFYLYCFIVLYDTILKDFIILKLDIDVSEISQGTLQLINNGNIYFVAPIIFKLLKDSIPDFIKLIGELKSMNVEVNENKK